MKIDISKLKDFLIDLYMKALSNPVHLDVEFFGEPDLEILSCNDWVYDFTVSSFKSFETSINVRRNIHFKKIDMSKVAWNDKSIKSDDLSSLVKFPIEELILPPVKKIGRMDTCAKKIKISYGTEVIESNAFHNYELLSIPASVTAIKGDAVRDVRDMQFFGKSPFVFENGQILSRDKKILYCSVLNGDDKFIVPECVEHVGNRAFYTDRSSYCRYKLILSKNLKSMGSSVFKNRVDIVPIDSHKIHIEDNTFCKENLLPEIFNESPSDFECIEAIKNDNWWNESNFYLREKSEWEKIYFVALKNKEIRDMFRGMSVHNARCLFENKDGIKYDLSDYPSIKMEEIRAAVERENAKANKIGDMKDIAAKGSFDEQKKILSDYLKEYRKKIKIQNKVIEETTFCVSLKANSNGSKYEMKAFIPAGIDFDIGFSNLKKIIGVIVGE